MIVYSQHTIRQRTTKTKMGAQPNADTEPRDKKLSRLWLAGVKMTEIAAQCGYGTPQAVGKAVKRLGLPLRHPNKNPRKSKQA